MLIAFEGVDGSGKSTAAKKFSEMLKQRYGDDRVVLTRDPGGTDVALDIRNTILGNDMDPITELLLYSAARREIYVNVIRPALMHNKIVISDRFVDSTIVYQHHARIDERDCAQLNDIEMLHEIACENARPDLTFIMDTSVEIVKSRIDTRNEESNRFDLMGEKFFDDVVKGFAQIGQGNRRYKFIDAGNTIDEVQSELQLVFDNFLLKSASKSYIDYGAKGPSVNLVR